MAFDMKIKNTPGVKTNRGKVNNVVTVKDRDGQPASMGSSEGFWPEVSDYVTTVDQRFGRTGFPRNWPEAYTSSKALRRLLGKKGLKGNMSKTVDVLSKSDLRMELPELAQSLKPGSEQSFQNALEVERARGWRVVKGFAVYDLHDCPEGQSYVAHKHWWNAQGDGTWVDYTPAEPGSLTASVLVRLLVESELGAKASKVLDYGAHATALSLLKEKDQVEREAAKVMAQRASESAKVKVHEGLMAQCGLEGGGGAGAALDPASALMMAPEAERLIEAIKTFGVEEVGSDGWMKQHESLQRLNLQAHHNVAAMSDEFVKEAFISLDKFNELVHELLVVEIWKEKVYPLLGSEVLEGRVGSTNIYLVLYHESVLVNLIEIMLFHKESLEALSSDSLLELVDYCHRKINYLNSGQAKEDAQLVIRSAQEVMDMSKADEMADKVKELNFGIALSSISVLRYATDYGNDLPLGVMARMLDTHDTIVQLVPLLEERPWMRRRSKGQGKDKVRLTEVFNEGRWQVMPPEDRLKLCKADAQVWIALYNLITDPKCRGKYRYDDFRRETVTRLQRHFNEVLFDQIPMLQDLQRTVSEIVFMVTPPSAEMTQGRLILEQVPELRDALLRRRDWKKMAKNQVETVFADTEENLANLEIKIGDMLKAFDFMSLLEGVRLFGCHLEGCFTMGETRETVGNASSLL